MTDSIHDKLKRVRKPRVHITYDLEANGASATKELPFVMGVMGDYSGDNTENKKPLKEREFVKIDRDNFNEVMAKVSPELNIKVENTLQGDGSEVPVNLKFNTMEDFEPHKVIEQVDSLKKLLDTRNKLRDLLTKADRSDKLETLLEQVLSNSESISALNKELGLGDAEGKEKG